MRSGIYTITNTTTGCVYVGSTNDFTRRWTEHKTDLRCKRHANRYLQFSWNKYGEDSFHFEVLERCAVAVLFEREQSHLDALQGVSGLHFYNLSKIAAWGSKSPEALARLSQYMTGNTNTLGYRHTDEARAAMSLAHSGRTKNAETRERMRQAAFKREAWRKEQEPLPYVEPDWLSSWKASNA